MEVYKYHSNITQKRHGESRNYRYVLDVSDTPRLLKILVMVGEDGGGRGRAMVQMPRLLKFYYKVGAGGVWVTVELRRLLKFA